MYERVYIYICVYLDISVKLCMYVSLMSGAWGRMVGIIEAEGLGIDAYMHVNKKLRYERNL